MIKMKRKRKKGSSIVMVIFITTIIFTTATTLLALVSGDYKARVNQSKELQNLYGADSGLNYVYNIIEKEAEAAIVIANNNVFRLMTTDNNNNTRYLSEYFSGGSEYNYDLLNGLFKSYFIKALLSNDNIDEIDYNNNIKNSIKTLTYRYIPPRDSVREVNDIDYYTRLANYYSCNGLIRSSVLFNDDENSDVDEPMISINEFNSNYFNNSIENYTNVNELKAAIEGVGEQYITVEVQSTFKDSNNKATKSENKKTIKTKFTIKAPDYEQALNGSNSYGDYKLYPVIKILAADKNININNSDVNISDEIWAGAYRNNGEITSNNAVSQKYNKGVIIDNSTVTFADNANIHTNGSISLNNESTLNTNNSDIYALNVYAGRGEASDDTGSNTVNSRNIVTENDLVMNSTNSTFNISNYYGINDHTFASETDIVDDEIIVAAKESSSIIVNNPNGDNNININDAYVNGVAYINLEQEKYQTGESVAVKGNYQAYTEEIAGENYEFKNYAAYSLIKGSVEDKKNHFTRYYTNRAADKGGVSIDRLYAVGASVNENNQVVDIPQNEDVINGYKRNYAQNVLNLGYEYENNESVMNAYNNGVLSRTLAHNNARINFNLHDGEVFYSIPNIVNNNNVAGYANYIYLPYDEDGNEPETIYITSTGIRIGDNANILSPTISGNELTYSVLIFTAGDIVIDGSGVAEGQRMVFDGSLVAGGNININRANIDFRFDRDRANYTINITDRDDDDDDDELTPDERLITNVFANAAVYTEERIQTGTDYRQDLSSIRGYDANKYLKKGLWKIVR